jgi:hypothetical protein
MHMTDLIKKKLLLLSNLPIRVKQLINFYLTVNNKS